MAGIYFAATGSYPVEFVNWQPVPYGTYNIDSEVAINYYNKTSNGNLAGNDKAIMEIRRAILESLVEDRLIEFELQKRIKTDDLRAIINDKINSVVRDSGADTEKQIRETYGLSMADFKEYVLRPQAKREILEARLLLDDNGKTLVSSGDVLAKWLIKEKAAANVVVLLPGFLWEGKGMVAN
ncbi:MAG: hypothetical protein NTW60_03135 [Candidatus Wolfebacteria bacterium]|nr:hypothetical protein [Candidatus Wolfebacteria bacterium]